MLDVRAAGNERSPAALAAVLRRRWRWAVAGVAATLLLTAGYLLVADPVFRSTASVLVTPLQEPGPTGDQTASEVNLDTEAQLVVSTATVQQAQELLEGDLTDQQLVSSVDTYVPPNTAVLEISFAAPTATGAQQGAQAFAEAYLIVRAQGAENDVARQIESVENQLAQVRNQLDAATARVQAAPDGSAEQAIAQADVNVLTGQVSGLTQSLSGLESTSVTPGRIIVDADLPDGAEGLGGPALLAAGLLAGVLVGVGFAMARERADRSINGIDDVERLVGLPTIALPAERHAPPVRELEPSTTPAGREFRRLRNALSATLLEGRRVVVVTAAGNQTDSALVAGNLAAALAQGGHEVTLVGADPDAPPLSSIPFGNKKGGLAEALTGTRRIDDVAHPVPAVPRLRVMPPGADTRNLPVLMQHEKMASLLESLAGRNGFVVVQAASASKHSDAQSLAGLADAAVVVVEAGRTRSEELFDVVDQLQQVRVPEISCVVVPATERPDRRESPSLAGQHLLRATRTAGSPGTVTGRQEELESGGSSGSAVGRR